MTNEPTSETPGESGDPLDSPLADQAAAAEVEVEVDAAAEAVEGDIESLEALGDADASAAAQVLAERDDYLDSLRRLQADFDNYRKRVRVDTELEVARGTEKVVSRLLPVLDTFEMALAHEAEPNASPLAKLHDQLLSALEAEGLERLFPLLLAFDPADAEAVVHEPGDGDPAAGPVVSEVLRAGYRWKGRVMRAAMVKVRG